ncbi:MAG TPA: hypothetical protein VD828_00855 [Candidatus Nitrosotenuis sp.]|nr:hypothetical protein [Candidatus Nitrosotenuis sp.]
MLTLLTAAFAAYGITNLNAEMQTTEPINMPDYSDKLESLDYSDELSSLNSQISTIKNDLAVLKDLKSDVVQIQQQLDELEKREAVQQSSTPPQIMTLDLDKTTYLQGDTVKITAFGIEPQKMVRIDLVDRDDFVLVHREAWADSAGKVLYQLNLSSALLQGNYEVRLSSDRGTISEQIRVVAAESANSVLVDNYVFTVKTNKSLYQSGEIIEVSGTGKPNSPVSATLTSPAGKTFTATSSTQSDGDFIIFFSTSSNFEDGRWYITTNHISKTIVVSITLD